MKDNEQNKIYIEKDEKTPSIIRRIERCKEKEIILVVPHNALILNNILNLKILKKEVERLNKNIFVVKVNRDGEPNEKTSFEKIDNSDLLDSKKNVKTNHEKIVKMFDIVKKVDGLNEFDKKNHKSIVKKEENQETDDNYQKDFKKSDNDVEFQPQEKLAESEIKTNKKISILPLSISKIIALFIFISFVAVSLAVAFVLPRADINITLKKEIKTYDFKLVANKSLDKIDIVNNKIPLKKIKVVNKETANYITTGKKYVQEKASGEVTVFNEFSSTPQRLVGNPINGYTRFLSKNGKLFRIKKSVTIPGFQRIGGVDVPGQITVKIYADKPGKEYNISPTSFTLPALQEMKSPKYQFIYAKSTKAMTGGIDKEVSYFSESDYITAKEKLVKLINEKNKNDFSKKISKDTILLNSTKKEDKPKINTNIKIGDIADNFKIDVEAESSAFVISKSNLEKIIKEKISSKLEINKKLLDNSMSYKFGDIKIDNKDGKITIPVHISQGLIIKIDTEKLKKDVAGKNEAELKSYFRNMSGVMSADISFWPFWVNSIPLSFNKINIAIDTNNSM